MEKLNIAEILKNCPKGMELYSSLCGECKLDGVIQGIIHVRTNSNKLIAFYSNGRYIQDGECVLFLSKENRDWSAFQRPFKDGDILATDLGSVFYLNTRLNTDERYGCYVGIGGDGSFHICTPFAYKECCGLATEEEKQKLFDAIKANGYRWNPETKTLEKLIVPKFKVGDKVRVKNGVSAFRIIDGVFDTFYSLQMIGKIDFTDQDNWELVPNKFDISTLKPFDKVLVRDADTNKWVNSLYGYCDELDAYKYSCINGYRYMQCIPYENNEYLLGTSNTCNAYYKTWK